MRHLIKHKKLNRTSSHKQAMFANMATALIFHEQIHTTLAKAKALRPYLEPLVTKAKNPTLSVRRNIISKIKDELATDKLLRILGERYKNRQGGYLRIVKSGFRYGDSSPMAYIEFVDRDENAKGVVYIRATEPAKEKNLKKTKPKDAKPKVQKVENKEGK